MAAAMTEVSSGEKLAYALRKREARARSRELANAGVRVSLDAARVFDPLLRPAERRQPAVVAVAIGGSFTLHLAVALLAIFTESADSPRARPYEQAVQVQMAAPPKPAAPIETPPKVPPPLRLRKRPWSRSRFRSRKSRRRPRTPSRPRRRRPRSRQRAPAANRRDQHGNRRPSAAAPRSLSATRGWGRPRRSQKTPCMPIAWLRRSRRRRG